MVQFAGYDMPVQYPQGLIAEHRHTREQVSLFDVSHMGQISVSGPQAATALEQVLPIDVLSLAPIASAMPCCSMKTAEFWTI